MDIKVVICHRGNVLDTCLLHSPTHVISVTDKNKPEVIFPSGTNLLRLSFDDTLTGPNLFHVGAVLDFIRGNVKTCVVHCEGGSSRSGAIAAGVVAAKLGPTKIKQALHPWVGTICPNEKLSQLFDIALDAKGEVLAVCEELCTIWFERRMIDDA